MSVNHRLLSDFRTAHGAALDEQLTHVVASLMDKDLVKVYRISQDGTRVRACAGAASFRREERLEQMLEQARTQVQELKAMLEDPARAAVVCPLGRRRPGVVRPGSGSNASSRPWRSSRN